MLFSWRSLIESRFRQSPQRRCVVRSKVPVQIEPLEPRMLLSATLGDDHDEEAHSAFLDVHGDLPWVEEDLPADTDAGFGDDALPDPYAGIISGNDDISDVNDGSYDLSKTFNLNSNLGSNFTIYLDFNGHTTTGTYWNTYYNGGADIVTEAWSSDGDRSSFSVSEQQRIQRIWANVAEDFAPFDVNVTTLDPGVEALRYSGSGDTNRGIRVVIGPNSFFALSGGVAFLGSFNWGTDTPAFVFNSSEVGVREAISHEVGHTLRLYHDGSSSTSYYAGHGSGATGWAPIMGNSYYKSVTQWSQGEYSGANNTEDDLSIITTANGFGYRADDTGNTIGTAADLSVSGLNVSGQGIIERNTDVDAFSFTTGTGIVSIDVDKALYGANLDILAKLYDSDGNLIATSNPSASLNAGFSLSLTAGTYTITIEGTGTGDGSTGYTDYASLGNYWISGTVAASTPNQDPTAQNDSVSTDEDNAVLIDVMANDSDPDGNALTIVSVTNGSNGSVVIVNGKIRYTPNANFFGTDTFTYTVGDGNGGTNTATVTVTVVAVPEIASLTGPGGTITDTTPTITWNNQSDAVRYEIIVYRTSTGQQVVSDANVTVTSYTVGTNLTVGGYQVFLRAVNAGDVH
ncbi:MAG: cadherin-like domain-containing protein, partial [Planctomycetes bacterium]|nr:cadherin-like domain-containing protein [Planctomycetota bacterium]